MFCGARTRTGGRCQRYPLAGKRRCLLHGGKSTGPRTVEGLSRTLSALWWGRKRYVEQRHSMGLPAAGGRPASIRSGEGGVDMVGRAMAAIDRELETLPTAEWPVGELTPAELLRET